MAAAIELPFVDEQRSNVSAGVRTTWAAVLEVVPTMFEGRGKELFARTIGCEQVGAAEPGPLRPGSAFTGFCVASLTPEKELRLEGRHRFSAYALTFRIERVEEEVSRLRAETRAEFPRFAGWLYRSLVIGTRIHVLLVRDLLRAIRVQAEG